MADKSLAAGVTTANAPIEDELVANNHHLLFPEKATLVAGQNLQRGALLGRITASGKLTLSTSAAGDGSQTPVGILVHDRNATADAEVLIYVRGDFNQDRVIYGAGHTPDSVRAGLADRGIFLHKRYGAPLGNAAQA